MKRIVAMLLAAAAVVCCAGCGAGGAGAQATTMTEEDFYVYENGEVVQKIDANREELLNYKFTEEEETKRGIHIGSTIAEVEEAYKGEWANLANMSKAETKWIHVEDNSIVWQTALLSFIGFEDQDGKFYTVTEEMDESIYGRETDVYYHLLIRIKNGAVVRIIVFTSL